MKKKLLLGVILVLLLSLTAPAYAAQNGCTTKIDTLCNLPEIQVTVPATAEVYINPFEIPVEIDGASITEQIVSTPASIENRSDVPLKVTVAVTGGIKAASSMRLVTSSTRGGTSRTKSAFVYFEIQASNSASSAVWDSTFNSTKHIVVRDGEGRPVKDVVTLDQAGKPNHFGVFRLTGDCVPTPRDAWTEDDGIDVKIAFTFTPLMRENP